MAARLDKPERAGAIGYFWKIAFGIMA